MSSYLWRYFLENDAESFHRLVGDGAHGPAYGSAQRNAPRPAALTQGSSPGLSKSPASFGGKQRPGSPPANVVLTKQTLRELDAMGRAVLHLACSTPDGLPFVRSLAAHPSVDLTVADLESGWTPLHRALYHGNLSAAREMLSAHPGNWSVVKAKDHAGDTPFEVFGASIHGIEEKLAEQAEVAHAKEEEEEEDHAAQKESACCGDEVFSWGSNKNLTLGFADGDDRSYPERVSVQRPRQLLLEQAKLKYAHLPENAGKRAEELLDASTLFSPQRVADVQLSKLHTAILTADPHSNLFICGFGRGGRLGFGDEQNAQFTFRPLTPPLLPKKKVESVAVGLDHTVAVLAGGEVWTWGGNQWGQLGYAVQQKTPKEEPIQSTPRQVFGLLKKETVIGCAASRIHTAVFTSDSLFTWGKNEGQLGILDSSDAKTLASQSTPRKVAANFLTGAAILDVCALEMATAVLLENHEVWILAGYGYSKLTFSTWERFASLPRSDNQPNYIHKITGSGDVLCALSRMGDVFTVDVSATLKERAERGSGKVAWTTQRAWSLRKRHMAVRDVAVGAEGSIIICTQSGSVWKRVKRLKAKEGSGDSGRYKFDRVPGLTRIVAVRSSSFGSFAAMRKDCDMMRNGLAVREQGLWNDVAGLMAVKDLLEDEGDANHFVPEAEDDESAEAEWAHGPRPRPRGFTKAVQWFMGKDPVQELRNLLVQLEIRASPEDWDLGLSTTTCQGLEVPVHRVVFSRSPVLRKLFAAGSGKADPLVELVPAVPGKRAGLVLHGMDVLTLLNLVYYMYVDTIIDVWHQPRVSKLQAAKFKELRTEMAAVATCLDLKPLGEAVSRMHYPSRTMDADFRSAFKDRGFFATTDMVIDLADDESINVHSAIMRSRCPFFEALYSGGASGRWLLGRRGATDPEDGIHVDMKHIPKNIMEMVVSWIYGDWSVEGFDGVHIGVEEGEVDAYLDFVLDVLSTANELMLDRLAQVCQKVLGGFVNTRNAAGLLSVVAGCSERMFKDGCLQYICLNLETMLENQLLDDMDEDLMADLDETVRSNQRRLFPNSRAGTQEKLLEAKYPSMRHDSARERAAIIATYAALEEEAQLSSSLKAPSSMLFSSSPSATPASRSRRKSSRVALAAAPSPTIKSMQPPEDIFPMDGDDGEFLPAPATSSPPSRASGTPRRIDIAGKGKAPAIYSSSQPSPSTSAPIAPSTATPPQVPWTTPVKSTKLAMKEIMEQAASSAAGKSALTAQLTSGSPKPDAGAGFKMSQKERKRREQQQQQQASSPASVERVALPTGPKEKKPAWNITPGAAAPRISLKEVLGTASSGGPAPPAAQKSPVPSGRTVSAGTSASTPRTMPSPQIPLPMPHRSSGSSSAAPAFAGPPAFKLGLDDIIHQEQAQKQAIEEFKMKKSLEDIQAEQEFMQWWESESRRVQMEEKAAAQAAGRGGRKGGRGGGERGRSRGRGGGGGGGRGRGRGRAAGEGAPQAVVRGV